ncbi:hypothetical protein B0H14DRAFT_3588621 [Mycena olivaceomarginata]|nr:hypothetical protein B0H14DRAFT_3588621 [Mycena olivaceomarginata]
MNGMQAEYVGWGREGRAAAAESSSTVRVNCKSARSAREGGTTQGQKNASGGRRRGVAMARTAYMRKQGILRRSGQQAQTREEGTAMWSQTAYGGRRLRSDRGGAPVGGNSETGAMALSSEAERDWQGRGHGTEGAGVGQHGRGPRKPCARWAGADMQRRQREPRSVGGEGAVWRQVELVGILEVLNVGQTVISSRSKKGNTQIDMTRIMPAEAALDVVAILVNTCSAE